MPDYGLDELMCVLMAREIRNGDWVNHGAVVPLAGAALMLAKKTHAPDVDFFYLGTVFNSINPSEVNLSEMMIDPSLAYSTSRMLMAHADILNWTVRGGCDLQFLRPLQMDAEGSVNVSLIGDPARPKHRFHGIAVADVMVTCKRPTLYTTDHDRRTFPETLPFRTGLGHTGGGAWRRNLGAGAGPHRMFTPLGVLDFAGPGGRARLRAVNPRVTPAQVQEATGFELPVAEDLEETVPPTDEELTVLREVVDPLGVRQTEFKTMRAEANARIEAARLARGAL
jgi:glutaconate CoA-transferase subunit B